MKILFCWLGGTDIRASQQDNQTQPGPIAAGVDAIAFEKVVILNNYSPASTSGFVEWLGKRSNADITKIDCSLPSPMDFAAIYKAAVKAVDDIISEHGKQAELTFHLSPGTSAMASIWVILSKAKYQATLIQSSVQAGVQLTDIPFEIAADFIPDMYRKRDAEISRLTAGLPPESPAFSKIIHRSEVMQQTVAIARRYAARNVRVLIEGESGTGKELMARAIHDGSLRRNKEMKVINCGAIPENLVESILFGHKKGAFTGAVDTKGMFEAADKSSLFLDEIGELPLGSQVKLLRVLQEGKVMPVGGTREIKVDVRIITATNRNLPKEMSEGRFREDLFYRLAEVIISLPPLRARGDDIKVLIDSLLSEINNRFADEVGYQPKQLTVTARKALMAHNWPGNVRELQSTLTRAAIISPSDQIDETDIDRALFRFKQNRLDTILDRPLGLDISKLLEDVKRHYVERAYEESAGNMTKAAELLGLKSYKVFGAWLDKGRNTK